MASLVAQLVGGLLILYSIDSNIGVIKQKSLLLMLTSYFKEFPLIERPIVIQSRGASMGISGVKGMITIDQNPQCIDEKIEYLQEQINELKKNVEQESKKLNEKIERQSEEINTQIQVAKSTLRNLESKINEISIGGIKVQLFGVLLMVYGAIAGYVA
jgi:hypothetical protein